MIKNKIGLLFLLASLWVAGKANALGLGEITAFSGLNEPLDAEIELLNTADLSNEDILVSIGTASEYQLAGVQREFFHTTLQFEVDIDGETGNIGVFSTEPVREPFLNFVLQIRWPQGKLLREYTILIDLPVFSGRTAAAPSTRPQTASNSSDIRAPQPDRQASGDRLRVPGPESVSSPRNSGRTGSAGEALEKGENYRVQSGNTLWGIGGRLAESEGVTRYQAMLAIRDSNPNAFLSSDPSSLKSGALLRLPDDAQIRSRSASDAFREFSSLRGGGITATPIDATGSAINRDAPNNRSGNGGRLALVSAAAVDEQSAGSGTGSNAGSSRSIDAIEGQNAVLKEELDRAEEDNQDLRERVASLEEQIKVYQELLEVEDKDLADVAAAADLVNANADQKSDSSEQLETAADQASDDSDELASGPVDQTDVQQSVPQQAAAPQPAPGVPQNSGGGLIGLLPYAAAGLLVIIVGVLVFLRRRRQQSEDLATEQALFDSDSPADEPEDDNMVAAVDDIELDDGDGQIESMDDLFDAEGEEAEEALEIEDNLGEDLPDLEDDAVQTGVFESVAAADQEEIDSAIDDLDEFADLDAFFDDDEIEDLDLEAEVALEEDAPSIASEQNASEADDFDLGIDLNDGAQDDAVELEGDLSFTDDQEDELDDILNFESTVITTADDLAGGDAGDEPAEQEDDNGGLDFENIAFGDDDNEEEALPVENASDQEEEDVASLLDFSLDDGDDESIDVAIEEDDASVDDDANALDFDIADVEISADTDDGESLDQMPSMDFDAEFGSEENDQEIDDAANEDDEAIEPGLEFNADELDLDGLDLGADLNSSEDDEPALNDKNQEQSGPDLSDDLSLDGELDLGEDLSDLDLGDLDTDDLNLELDDDQPEGEGDDELALDEDLDLGDLDLDVNEDSQTDDLADLENMLDGADADLDALEGELDVLGDNDTEDLDAAIDDELSLDLDADDDISIELDAVPDSGDAKVDELGLDDDLDLDKDLNLDEGLELDDDLDLGGGVDLDDGLDLGDDLLAGLDGFDDAGSDADEFSTKFELAEAYLDMGDAKGARELLDEIQSSGSLDSAQTQSVQELVDRLENDS